MSCPHSVKYAGYFRYSPFSRKKIRRFWDAIRLAAVRRPEAALYRRSVAKIRKAVRRSMAPRPNIVHLTPLSLARIA